MYINFKADRLKPYAPSLTIRSSCNKESNAADKSVSSAPKELSLSLLKFHFSNIALRQCCRLIPCPDTLPLSCCPENALIHRKDLIKK